MAGPERQGRGSEIDYKGVTIVALVIAAIIGVAALAMIGVFQVLSAREARPGRASTLAPRPAGQLPPEPRLQSDPAGDLATMRAEEERRLAAYGWADEGKGLARVPVDRAMELLVSRGLPSREGQR